MSSTLIASPSATDDKSAQLEDWKVCYKVGLLFQAKLKKGHQRCVGCSNLIEVCPDIYRCTFLIATRCQAGHSQISRSLPATETRAIQETEDTGICQKCDKTFVLKVLKRQIGCQRDGCRRNIGVNLVVVKHRLKNRPELLRCVFF